MSESDEAPPPPRLTPEQIQGIGELNIGDGVFADPSMFAIPDDAVKHWTGIPADQKVFLSVSRKDMDHLFFFFAQQSASITMLQRAMQTLSHGDTPGAVAFFAKSQQFNSTAEANFRRFFAAVMAEAKPDA